MGIMLVVVVFYDDVVIVVYIGDLCMYCFCNGEFFQVIKDYFLLQEQIDSGMIMLEQVWYLNNCNFVMWVFGVDLVVVIEIYEYLVEFGDIYLLCLDGFNDMVEDEEIGMMLEVFGVNFKLCV